MTDQYVYDVFHASIEAKMQAGEALAPLIVAASEQLVQCLLNEGKILACGNGPCAGLAQIFTHHLIHDCKRERPSLPAVTLGSDIVNVTAIANENSFNDVFAREIRAIGQSDDILLVICCSGNSSNILQAVQAAHERGMHIIALTGCKESHVSSLLDTHDKELCAAVEARARIHEIHLLVLFCLCDLIEEKLFGPME